ncbi:MAG: hypothetical protein OCC45_02385 [Desulfotalea sp.]
MIENKRLILVGGTGRNVGKTQFVCDLIKSIANNYDVYGLKVSAIYPDEEIFHGNHDGNLQNQRLFEETRNDTKKDTSRMLRAGANRVFYLQSDDVFIQQGYLRFLELIPKDAIIVCESNSLGYHVKPLKHIIIKSETGKIKPRSLKQLESADIIITSKGGQGFPELQEICSDMLSYWKS